MPAPTFTISANTDEFGDRYESRNPSWCVAFIRFKTPGFMFSGGEDPLAEKPLLIIENDCVSVNISNPKASFAKTCQLSMRPGDTWYPHAVSPGDYVFVWMSDQQDKINLIIDKLRGKSNKASLNGWDSGLKFFGRVMGVSTSDSIASSGQRSINQTVNCQAFTELSSSIYYTFVAQENLTGGGALDLKTASTNFLQSELEKLGETKASSKKKNISAPQKGVTNGLDAALTNLSGAFLDFYQKSPGSDATVGDTSPEAIIGLLFIITMGVDKTKSKANNGIPGANGVFSDAIGVPKSVASIFGKRASKLYEIYNLNLGLQKYSNNKKEVWQNFSPSFTKDSDPSGIFHRTSIPCKGFVPFLVPPIWDNNSFWNIYSQFLNPIVNEMYTALKINREGKILPHLIVREQPFSTGLYDFLMKKAPVFTQKGAAEPKKKNAAEKVASLIKEKTIGKQESPKSDSSVKEYDSLNPLGTKLSARTMYKEIPRWVIDESVILSIDSSPSEANRVNFVQVWGRNRAAELIGGEVSQEVYKRVQLGIPNYVADDGDIKRHGLRADISETIYDVSATDYGTISHILCRMRADWLLNGHLKHFGSITLQGVVEPICEGDNLLVRGILFHIEAVSHSSAIDSSGRKVFRTTCQISNGTIAESLDTKKGIPQYPTGNDTYSNTDSMSEQYNLPGIVDLQYTSDTNKRTSEGEPV